MSTDRTVLDVRDLRVRFVGAGTGTEVVRGISFRLKQGDTLAVVGESGSGKSVSLRAVMRLLPPRRAKTTGSVRLEDQELLTLPEDQLARIRGRDMAMIFQEPALAFDPVFPIGYQIIETIRQHTGVDHATARSRALELLEQVQIPSPRNRLESYPHEMSGGMLQRAMIAVALCCRPKLLIADEPTTALDATVQVQILLLLRQLQRAYDMAVIFVTHDIGVAVEMADRVSVMYAGQFVESAPVRQILRGARHPYSRGLLDSTITNDKLGKRLIPIGGSPPDPAAPMPGCAFAPRCGLKLAHCDGHAPETIQVAEEHQVRCHLVQDERTSSGFAN
jgi:peptide/nickel transport system ATP-binding protein